MAAADPDVLELAVVAQGHASGVVDLVVAGAPVAGVDLGSGGVGLGRAVCTVPAIPGRGYQMIQSLNNGTIDDDKTQNDEQGDAVLWLRK